MEGSRMPGWGVQESFGLLTNFEVVVPVKHQQTDTSGARDPEMDPRTLVHFFLESFWLVSSTVKGTASLVELCLPGRPWNRRTQVVT